MLGAIGAGVFLWPFEGPAFEYNALRFALFGGFAGLFGGGAFWALGIRKNRALTTGPRGDAPQAARA